MQPTARLKAAKVGRAGHLSCALRSTGNVCTGSTNQDVNHTHSKI